MKSMRYAINLLWIQNNGSPKHPNPFIYHAHKLKNTDPNTQPSAQERIENELFLPALRWAQHNPEATVYIWYDSSKVSAESINNTHLVLNQYKDKHHCNSIALRDIQDIAVVHNNPLIFSNRMGLYARVDFLKIILGHYCIHVEAFDHCIYTDITQPNQYLGADSLFSETALSSLESHGILINYKFIGPYILDKNTTIKPNGGENQFIQFAKNPTLELVLTDVINAGVIQAAHQLQQPAYEMGQFYVNYFQYVTGGQGHLSVQQLYSSYKNQCCFVNTDALVLTDQSLFKNTHGWKPFSTQRFGYLPLGTCYQTNQYKLLSQIQIADGRFICNDVSELLQLPKIDNLTRTDIYYRDGRNHIDVARGSITHEITPYLI